MRGICCMDCWVDVRAVRGAWWPPLAYLRREPGVMGELDPELRSNRAWGED